MESDKWFQAFCSASFFCGVWEDDPSNPHKSILNVPKTAERAAAYASAAIGEYLAHLAPRASEIDPLWTGHARVELLGHRSYLGRIREVERYGTKMGEVQELLPSGDYGESHLFGGKSVYEIRQVSRDDALAELRQVTKWIACSACGSQIEFDANWQHPLYNEPKPLCDDCKGKPEAERELPFEPGDGQGNKA